MFLAHHEQAERLAAAFAARAAELAARGLGAGEAAERAAEAVEGAAAAEVRRKIGRLRREGLAPEGRGSLVARGLVQRGSAQDVLLRWESEGSKTVNELDERWARCQAYFEAHVYRNIQAFAFNGLRRDKALEPSAARSPNCAALLARPEGQALISGLAEVGVGCLDGFAEPGAVGSLHSWLEGLYKGGQFREETISDCNRGSFNTVIDFDLAAHGAGLRWLSPPGLPEPAAAVLTQLVGLAAELEDALGLPLLLERQLHVGVHPAGGPLYSRHLDKYDFEVGNHRTVTCLLYTNPSPKGGELVVYPPAPGTPVSSGALSEKGLRFQPVANRLVCFWSRTAFHEVLPSPAPGPPRFAVTLWAQSGGSWRAHGFRPPADADG